MNKYLDQDRLPPTRWELREKHCQVFQETMANNKNMDKRVLDREYRDVQTNLRTKRDEMLLEAVLGTKNYVPHLD